MTVFSATKTFSNLDGIGPFPALLVQNHAILVYVFLAVSAMVLLACSALNDRIAAFFGSRRSVIVAGAFGFVGTMMLLLGAGTDGLMTGFAAICVGVGVGFFVILFGNAFAEFKFGTAVLNAAIAVAVGFICAVAFVNWIPSPVSGIIAAIMPLLMSAAFWSKKHVVASTSENGFEFSYIRTYIVKFGICAALFGIVVGTMRVICADRLLTAGGITVELVLGAGCIVSVLVFVFAIAASKKETYWDSLFRSITPVVMLGLACMVALVGDFELIAAFFVALAFVCLVSLLWIFLSCMARNLGISSIFIFGLGYGLIQLASIVGSFAAASALEGVSIPAEYSQIGLAKLALFAIVVYSAAYMIAPRYREMRAIISSIVREVVAVPEAPLVQIKPRPATSAPAAPAPKAESAEEAEPRDDKGSFVRRCEEICANCKLSTREKEVFFLLAKGHNAAYITDKLCISRSTAKTHINHIYKKTDIHTQQELLNMVEDRPHGPVGKEIDRDALLEVVRRASEEGPLERNPSLLVEHIQRDIAVGSKSHKS